MLVIPAPGYSLAQGAWIPRITIWRDDGIIQHRDGKAVQELGSGDGGKLEIGRASRQWRPGRSSWARTWRSWCRSWGRRREVLTLYMPRQLSEQQEGE